MMCPWCSNKTNNTPKRAEPLHINKYNAAKVAMVRQTGLIRSGIMGFPVAGDLHKIVIFRGKRKGNISPSCEILATQGLQHI